jgi:thiosulfate/3-mercaptopyruvate sulfurtransferase
LRKLRHYEGFIDAAPIISVDAAKHLLQSPDTVFVDTRNYWKYVKGHIPGAVNFETYAFHWIDTSKPGLLAFNKQMEMLISSLGIDKTKNIIFYENTSGYDAARGVWLLSYLGHKKSKLLDGGLNMWKRMKLPIDTRDPPIRRANFRAKPDYRFLVTMKELLSIANLKGTAEGTKVIDARTPGEFLGKNKRAVKAGHIPGALNVEWARALRRDGSLKKASTLRRMYKNIGLKTGQEAITYCQSGYRAAHSWLVLKALGYDARNYLGSWYEWGNNTKAPVTA